MEVESGISRKDHSRLHFLYFLVDIEGMGGGQKQVWNEVLKLT